MAQATIHHQSSDLSQCARIHHIALLFNANKVYDREIIAGIGDYMRFTRVTWGLFLEENFRCRLPDVEHFDGDGIIMDFDDPAVAEALRGCPLPVVAVGSSYEGATHYPTKEPCAATDSGKLVALAYRHLIEAGLQHFALYSLPQTPENRWAQEYELALTRLRQRGNPAALVKQEIYRGLSTNAPTWHQAISRLIEWLRDLPKPIGIITVTNARARHLLQAYTTTGFTTPEEIAIIGIDNDPLTRTLSRIPLSSVIQGTVETGRTAAHLLHQMLGGTRLTGRQILMPPMGIDVLVSSRHQPLAGPCVVRTWHFIRQHAYQGTKTEQVAGCVGISRLPLEGHFRRELSCTMRQEILHHKLDAAKHMLASRDVTTAEVTAYCGFTFPQYMHAVFRRELDYTPHEYRRRATTRSQS